MTRAASTGLLDKVAIVNNLKLLLGSLTNFPNATYPGTGGYKSYDAGLESWITNNVPFLETPLYEIDQAYYYRWWLYHQHIQDTGNLAFPYVVTEFYPDVYWAGLWNTINCAAGHHFRDGRWLKDTRYMNSYERFWLEGGGSATEYSFWIADSYYNKFLVDGNTNLLIALLPGLTNLYSWWGNPVNGKYDANRNLYLQMPTWDGMETDVDSYEENGAACYRASINSYMFGDAMAIIRIAALAGNASLADVYSSKAALLKTSFQTQMWDTNADCFWDRRGDNFAEFTDFELIGYTPWYFNLPDAQYSSAWQYLVQTNDFNGKYGLRTARPTYPAYKSIYAGANWDYWDGFIWPYETAVVLTGMANLLNNYSQTNVTSHDFFTQLYNYAISMRQTAQVTNSRLSIMEFEDPDTGVWNPTGNNDRAYDYNHSSFNDLVINGLIGVRPQPGNVLQINPLVPTNWDYFCLEDVPYHGRMVTVMFDRNGTHYGKGAGFHVYIEDQLVYSNANVSPMTYDFSSIPPSYDPTVDENYGNLFNAALNTGQSGYPAVSASYTDSNSSVWQAVDGVVSYNNDPVNRWACTGSTNSSDWLAVDFGQSLTLSGVKVCFFADGMSNTAPASYSLQYWNGSSWLAVQNQAMVPILPEGNCANLATFSAVRTQKIRIVMNHQAGSHSAISEFEALAVPIGSLAVKNGGFELPAFGAGSTSQSAAGVGVQDWFSPTESYDAWEIGSGRVTDGSQACVFNVNGWIYQSLGAYHASNGTNLNWSLEQVTDTSGNNSANFAISFYAQTGAFYPFQGIDIEGAQGVTSIGGNPTATFPSLNSLELTNKTSNGTLNLIGLADGTIVWVRVANTGGGYSPIDNVYVVQTQSFARTEGLAVTNGGFEVPAFGANSLAQSPGGIGVSNWFSPTAAYEAWQTGSGRVVQNSQAVEFAPATGWIYQPLGTYYPNNGTNLSWSFQQDTDLNGGNSADFTISFYYSAGAFTPAQGTDINGASGATLIGTNSLNSLYAAGLSSRVNIGNQNLSGVPPGDAVWVRVANTGQDGPNGSGYAPIDNITVNQNSIPAPLSPTILPVHLNATSTNLAFSVATQTGYDYLLESATNLTPPTVWATNGTTVGTGGMITNTAIITPTMPSMFFRYLVQ